MHRNERRRSGIGSPRFLRNTTIAVLTMLLGLMIPGCWSGRYTYPDASRARTDGELVTERGLFKSAGKEYAADFGTIAVRENRSRASSRLIYLPVIRIRARSATPREPIFGLGGGPGVTNMKRAPLDSLLEDHDFVMVGYRGVDGSTVLDCPEVVQAIKAEDDLLGEAGLRRIGAAWGRSLERLKREGVDLDGYTIPETIGDMEAVRQALKHERVNLLSESYGTRVAYLYGLAHPEHLARSVMVGANPPGRFWWDDRKVEEQIADYARLWARDTVMARESTDLRATMRNVLNTLPRKWLFFTIDPTKVRLATFPLLFHRRTAAMVFDAYVAAERGDYSGLALMSLATDYVIPSMFVWGDLASKAMSADFDSTRQYGTEKPDGDRVLGSPLNVLLWGPLNYGHLPIRLIPAEFRRTKQSDVETLVLSGNIDFSTPAEYAAAELIPLLSRGRQVILSEYGHVGDIRNIHPEAAARIIVSYYNTGIADTSKAEYVPMDFRVDWGFPEFAKAALSGIVIIGAALLAGIIWWIRAVW